MYASLSNVLWHARSRSSIDRPPAIVTLELYLDTSLTQDRVQNLEMMFNESNRRAVDASLTAGEIDTLITIERTGAGLSMVAIFLTVLTFVLFKKLRTTPNLFLVFASIANAGASTASMMGYDGLRLGQNSTLCQAQAFIFEWYGRPLVLLSPQKE